MSTQWWLAEIEPYGLPTLKDGPHNDRAGVEKALYLFRRLGIGKSKAYGCAEVHLTDVEPVAHDANEEALGILNSNGLHP